MDESHQNPIFASLDTFARVEEVGHDSMQEIMKDAASIVGAEPAPVPLSHHT